MKAWFYFSHWLWPLSWTMIMDIWQTGCYYWVRNGIVDVAQEDLWIVGEIGSVCQRNLIQIAIQDELIEGRLATWNRKAKASDSFVRAPSDGLVEFGIPPGAPRTTGDAASLSIAKRECQECYWLSREFLEYLSISPVKTRSQYFVNAYLKDFVVSREFIGENGKVTASINREEVGCNFKFSPLVFRVRQNDRDPDQPDIGRLYIDLDYQQNDLLGLIACSTLQSQTTLLSKQPVSLLKFLRQRLDMDDMWEVYQKLLMDMESAKELFHYFYGWAGYKSQKARLAYQINQDWQRLSLYLNMIDWDIDCKNNVVSLTPSMEQIHDGNKYKMTYMFLGNGDNDYNICFVFKKNGMDEYYNMYYEIAPKLAEIVWPTTTYIETLKKYTETMAQQIKSPLSQQQWSGQLRNSAECFCAVWSCSWGNENMLFDIKTCLANTDCDQLCGIDLDIDSYFLKRNTILSEDKNWMNSDLYKNYFGGRFNLMCLHFVHKMFLLLGIASDSRLSSKIVACIREELIKYIDKAQLKERDVRIWQELSQILESREGDDDMIAKLREYMKNGPFDNLIEKALLLQSNYSEDYYRQYCNVVLSQKLRYIKTYTRSASELIMFLKDPSKQYLSELFLMSGVSPGISHLCRNVDDWKMVLENVELKTIEEGFRDVVQIDQALVLPVSTLTSQASALGKKVAARSYLSFDITDHLRSLFPSQSSMSELELKILRDLFNLCGQYGAGDREPNALFGLYIQNFEFFQCIKAVTRLKRRYCDLWKNYSAGTTEKEWRGQLFLMLGEDSVSGSLTPYSNLERELAQSESRLSQFFDQWVEKHNSTAKMWPLIKEIHEAFAIMRKDGATKQMSQKLHRQLLGICRFEEAIDRGDTLFELVQKYWIKEYRWNVQSGVTERDVWLRQLMYDKHVRMAKQAKYDLAKKISDRIERDICFKTLSLQVINCLSFAPYRQNMNASEPRFWINEDNVMFFMQKLIDKNEYLLSRKLPVPVLQSVNRGDDDAIQALVSLRRRFNDTRAFIEEIQARLEIKTVLFTHDEQVLSIEDQTLLDKQIEDYQTLLKNSSRPDEEEGVARRWRARVSQVPMMDLGQDVIALFTNEAKGETAGRAERESSLDLSAYTKYLFRNESIKIKDVFSPYQMEWLGDILALRYQQCGSDIEKFKSLGFLCPVENLERGIFSTLIGPHRPMHIPRPASWLDWFWNIFGAKNELFVSENVFLKELRTKYNCTIEQIRCALSFRVDDKQFEILRQQMSDKQRAVELACPGEEQQQWRQYKQQENIEWFCAEIARNLTVEVRKFAFTTTTEARHVVGEAMGGC